EKPILALDVKVKSKAENGVDIGMKVTVTATAQQRVIEVTDFYSRGQLGAYNDLNARFGAYARVFLGPKYTVFGALDQTGHSRMVQTLEPDGKISGRDLSVSTALKLDHARIQ